MYDMYKDHFTSMDKFTPIINKFISPVHRRVNLLIYFQSTGQPLLFRSFTPH